jgi:hypothetical protein
MYCPVTLTRTTYVLGLDLYLHECVMTPQYLDNTSTLHILQH